MHQLPDDRLAQAYALEDVVQASEATVVYRGHARASGDPVIAKVLRLQGSGVGEVHRLRFLKAVSALIKHAPAGVPPLKDAAWGQEAAVLLFVPVPGTRLTQLPGLTPPQAAHILARAAAALETLHQGGVAHVNLAPDNVLVVSAEKVFLTGLGWGFVRLPTSGAAFAAPEVRKAVDLAEPQRCDIYSLAFLTTTLFEADVAYGEEEARVQLPPSVREKLRQVAELEEVLARCLHQDPFERPSSVAVLAEALANAVPAGVWEEEGTVRLAEPTQQPVPAPEPEAATVVSLSVPAPAQPAPAPAEEASPQTVTPEPAPTAEPAVSPEPPPEAPPVVQPVQAPTAPAPAAHPRRRRWLWPALAGLALVLAAGGVLLLLPGGKAPVPTPTPLPPTPSPSPVPTPVLQVSPAAGLLDTAQGALREGDWEAAREALAHVSQGSLTDEERERFRQLELEVLAAQQQAGLASLRAAWRSGDVAGLRRALAMLEKVEPERFSPEDRSLLNQARAVQQALRRLAREEKAQRWKEVLEEAHQLESLLPGTREASRAQEQAAEALEAQAQSWEAQGQLDQALTVLETLERYLPARPGLAGQLERLRHARARQEQLRAVLERAARLGREGKPEQGLALVAELPADQRGEAQVQRLKEQLSQQLAQLDAGAPTVAPPSANFRWQYAKRQVAKIEVMASDDHGLARVTLFFRKKGDKSFRSVPMTKTSSGTFVAEIVPAVHGDQDLEFYVLAEDHSGHQGQLGSEQRPLEAKRKRGLFGF